MNAKVIELAVRRGALAERIAAQRTVLARHAVGLETLCAGGDKLSRGVDWLKQHPATVGAAVFVVVVARPKRAWRWARRGIFLWRGWRSLRQFLPDAR